MDRSTYSRLTAVLENLESCDLKKFKEILAHQEIKEPYSRIPKGKLQSADHCDLVNHLLDHYPEPYAVELTLRVLEAIPKKRLVCMLKSSVYPEYSLNSYKRAHFNSEYVTWVFRTVLLVTSWYLRVKK